MDDRRFVALDSWRGVCALLVAVHNLNFGPWLPQVHVVAHASLFVDFFFVLSGFVITHAYMDRLSTRRDVAAFMLRRLGRLWPLHVTMLVALVGLSFLRVAAANVLPSPPPHTASGQEGLMRTIATNLLLIQAFDAPSWLSWNAPSWSISTELWTYSLFSGICLLSANRRPPLALMASVALVAGGTVLALSPNFLETNTDYAFLRCLYGFFIGHLVYRTWEAIPFKLRGAGILEGVAVALVVGFVMVAGNDILSMAAPVIFGFAVWVFAQEKGSLSDLFRSRPFVRLGTWSYSIYMVHWLVRNFLLRADALTERAMSGSGALHLMFLNHNWVLRALLVGYLVAIIGIAAATYRFVEQPGRRVFNRVSERLLAAARRSP